MTNLVWTVLIATGLSAPLFKYPQYAIAIFTVVVIWNHFFPSEPEKPETLLLPTRKPYLDGLKPLDDPTTVAGEHCPTCWEEFDQINKPTRLACDHVFCNECILAWLNSGKNICPVCKSILFQQPTFQGEEAMAERVHKFRVCLAGTTILMTLVRQILAFIARHPGGVENLQWSWQFINPIYYLTGYGNVYKTMGVAGVAASDIAQIVTARTLCKSYGVNWFKSFPGHWAFWLLSIYTTISRYHGEMGDLSHLAHFVWRIFK